MISPRAFITSPTICESPAPAALESIEAFRRFMLRESEMISPDARAAFVRQWPELLDLLLIRSSRDVCESLNRTMCYAN